MPRPTGWVTGRPNWSTARWISSAMPGTWAPTWPAAWSAGRGSHRRHRRLVLRSDSGRPNNEEHNIMQFRSHTGHPGRFQRRARPPSRDRDTRVPRQPPAGSSGSGAVRRHDCWSPDTGRAGAMGGLGIMVDGSPDPTVVGLVSVLWPARSVVIERFCRNIVISAIRGLGTSRAGHPHRRDPGRRRHDPSHQFRPPRSTPHAGAASTPGHRGR